MDFFDFKFGYMSRQENWDLRVVFFEVGLDLENNTYFFHTLFANKVNTIIKCNYIEKKLKINRLYEQVHYN